MRHDRMSVVGWVGAGLCAVRVNQTWHADIRMNTFSSTQRADLFSCATDRNLRRRAPSNGCRVRLDRRSDDH